MGGNDNDNERAHGMRSGRLRELAAGVSALLLLGTGTAFADGPPHNWQLGFQEAASPIKEQMESFHNLLLVIIVVLTVFVLGLLVYVMWRFSASRNPVPSKTAHNTIIEVLWTVVAGPGPADHRGAVLPAALLRRPTRRTPR